MKKDPYSHIPQRYKGGLCYPNAFNFLSALKNSNYRLVHGWVTSQLKEIKGVRYSHAWLENIKTRTVVDPSASMDDPLVLSDFLYYKYGEIDPKRLFKYTRQEAIEMAVKTGTYGPWDDTFDENITNLYEERS